MFDKLNIKQKYSFFVVLILIALTLCIYWPVQNYGFTYFDDDVYVTRNSNIQAGMTLEGLRWAFTTKYFGLWNPLTWLSLMFDYQLFGFNAGGYHWTNVILHILNSVLLFLLFKNLTGAVWRSACVAALFAVHPINVESVVWIAERKNVFSTLFWITTMLFYVRYVRRPDWKRYLPVLISFTLGLMSKPMLVTLPFVLLLIDCWPLDRTNIIPPDNNAEKHIVLKKEKLRFLVLEKVPLFILSAISILIVLYNPQLKHVAQFSRSIDFTQKINNAIFSYAMYLKKLFWPTDLFIPYLYLHHPLWQIFLFAILLMLVTFIVCRYIKKYPYLSVGWFWYLGTLVPVIGVFQIGEHTMADRYAYVPFIGIFVIIAWSVGQIASKKNIFKKISIIAVVLSIGILALATYKQQELWSNTASLFEYSLKKDPRNYIAYAVLGQEMAKQDKNEKALYYYDMALKLNPGIYSVYLSKGLVLMKIGRRDDALEYFRKAIKLNKLFPESYYNLGFLYLAENNTEKAIAYFKKVIALNPDYIEAYNGLGVALVKHGKIQEGIMQFKKVLDINPHNKNAQKNIILTQQIMKKNNDRLFAP